VSIGDSLLLEYIDEGSPIPGFVITFQFHDYLVIFGVIRQKTWPTWAIFSDYGVMCCTYSTRI
jgi:hypothetical protein